MTNLAAQNHRIRVQQAKEERKHFITVAIVVVLGVAAIMTIALTIGDTGKQDCMNQGVPISCSLLK